MSISLIFNEENILMYISDMLAKHSLDEIHESISFKTDVGVVSISYNYPSYALDVRITFCYSVNGFIVADWEKCLSTNERSWLLSITAEKILQQFFLTVTDKNKHYIETELRKYYIDDFMALGS